MNVKVEMGYYHSSVKPWKLTQPIINSSKMHFTILTNIYFEDIIAFFKPIKPLKNKSGRKRTKRKEPDRKYKLWKQWRIQYYHTNEDSNQILPSEPLLSVPDSRKQVDGNDLSPTENSSQANSSNKMDDELSVRSIAMNRETEQAIDVAMTPTLQKKRNIATPSPECKTDFKHLRKKSRVTRETNNHPQLQRNIPAGIPQHSAVELSPSHTRCIESSQRWQRNASESSSSHSLHVDSGTFLDEYRVFQNNRLTAIAYYYGDKQTSQKSSISNTSNLCYMEGMFREVQNHYDTALSPREKMNRFSQEVLPSTAPRENSINLEHTSLTVQHTQQSVAETHLLSIPSTSQRINTAAIWSDHTLPPKTSLLYSNVWSSFRLSPRKRTMSPTLTRQIARKRAISEPSMFENTYIDCESFMEEYRVSREHRTIETVYYSRYDTKPKYRYKSKDKSVALRHACAGAMVGALGLHLTQANYVGAGIPASQMYDSLRGRQTMPYLQSKIRRLDLQTNISSAISINNQQYGCKIGRDSSSLSTAHFFNEHMTCGVMPDDAQLRSTIQSDFNSTLLQPDKCEETQSTRLFEVTSSSDSRFNCGQSFAFPVGKAVDSVHTIINAGEFYTAHNMRKGQRIAKRARNIFKADRCKQTSCELDSFSSSLLESKNRDYANYTVLL